MSRRGGFCRTHENAPCGQTGGEALRLPKVHVDTASIARPGVCVRDEVSHGYPTSDVSLPPLCVGRAD